MDSNKDEAERCIKIALNAITKNEQEKAKRFLEKAQRLFPTDKAKSRSTCVDGYLIVVDGPFQRPIQLTLA